MISVIVMCDDYILLSIVIVGEKKRRRRRRSIKEKKGSDIKRESETLNRTFVNRSIKNKRMVNHSLSQLSQVMCD